jgi:hypothetical protein
MGWLGKCRKESYESGGWHGVGGRGGGRGGNGYGGGGKWAALLALLVVFPCLILQQGEEDGF